ncbi:MAG: TolC family protein [Chitinophagaceae bacterium]|nr:TolC family protein [Chitinophagaceae bacterium]
MKFYLFISFLFLQILGFAQIHSLDYFIEQARTNSPAISEFNNQVLSNQLDSLLLRASLKTQVNFISSNSYAPVIKGFGYDNAITNGANITGVVQASRNFLTKNNVAAELNVLRLLSQSIYDTIKITGQDLLRTITEQYITAFGDQVQLDFNREIYDLLQNEEVVLKKLTRQSFYKQTDYLAFYVTLQQQQFAYLQSQIQYNADYLTLSYLAGMVDTTISRIERPTINDSLKVDFINSVFYKRFTTDSLRLEAEKRLIDYQYKPRLGAYADAGYNSSLLTTPYKNLGVSFGVSLTVPIYDGNQKRYKYNKVELLERSRQNRKIFYINQYRQQIVQLTQQLKSSDLLVTTINSQIRYINTLLSANSKLLETGDIKIADYVLAIGNYINARNLLNQNYIYRLRIGNQINYWNK